MGEYLARNQVSQLAISETQKFGHVTYFWNGNRTGMFDAKYEKYIEVPSDRVSFDERPWMKSAEITDSLIAELQKGELRHARLNYANGDMVGHTGNRDAAIIAMEALDLCLGRVIPVIKKLEGALIVTADHGNADEMYEYDKQGAIAVEHHAPSAVQPLDRDTHGQAARKDAATDAGPRRPCGLPAPGH